MELVTSPRQWYIVVPASPGDPNAPRLAYHTQEHADAIAYAHNFVYAAMAPWRVIVVVEVES
jgi:hypothetical protein